MSNYLRSTILAALVTATAAAALFACSDDETTTPSTPSTTDGGGGGTADSSTADPDSGGGEETKGNVVITAKYSGALTGPLNCLVLSDKGPVQQKTVDAPTFPQKVEANNIDPGEYMAICFVDANKNGAPDPADAVGPQGMPAPVSIKAGETTNVDIDIADPPPMDGGADSGDGG